MGSKAVDQQVHVQADPTHSMKSLRPDENSKSTSLPSPPSSVKATESESGRNENGSHPGEVAAGEPPVAGSSAGAHGGANAGMKNTAAPVGL